MRHVNEHCFVVPLLIGHTSQFDAVIQPFRDCCLSLNAGKLELGAIAQTLLRVYLIRVLITKGADKSTEMAANAIDLYRKHHLVVHELELLIEIAAKSNETCKMNNAYLTERFNAVAQSLRADIDWRQQQKTCFEHAAAVEDIWTYPCDWGKWNSSKEKDLCFVFSDMENIIKNAAALFEQHSTLRERETLT